MLTALRGTEAMVGLREGGEKHSWWSVAQLEVERNPPPPIPLSVPQMGTLDPGHMPPLC